MSKRTVAISGLGSASTLAPGLPVISALRTEPAFVKDWRVVGLAYDPLDPPSYDAELCEKSYLVAYPSQGAERLFERISYIHSREHIDVLLPTLDSELPLYIKLQPRLQALGIRLLLPSAEAFRLRAKTELPQVAERTGLRVPRSLAIENSDELFKKAQKLELPIVVKGNLHGATVVYSYDQLHPAAAVHASQWGYPIVLQEYIPGIEFDVAALGDAKGRLIGAVPMKKLQIDDRGKAWGAMTIDDPSLVQAAERAVAGLPWAGPLELELVRHQDSGEHYLIEINPRFPAWIHLCGAAGQNLPWALLRLAMGEEVAPFFTYQIGVLQLRRSVDVTCSLDAYQELVMRGEVDLRGPDKPAEAAAPAAQPDDSYERPSIVRHMPSIGNRFGVGHRYIDQIDGVAVSELVERYGSPLFAFSERVLRKRARAFLQAFCKHYPRVRPAWSYKTNYLDALCGILHQEGWDAEVVSDLEYAMARRLGIPGSRIICNGAYKPRAWLEESLRDGALVQIDHFDELDMLEEAARKKSGPQLIGLRVNMQIDALGSASWERFGFNLDNGEILDAILRIVASDSLRLGGLHCHLGTFINEPAVYREAAERMGELLRAAESLCGYRLEFINLGGGFPSSNVLGATYGEGDTDGPDIMPYAEAIGETLRNAFSDRPPDEMPTLILESGRHLIDDAGSLISTVVGTRRLASGERGLVLDAGLNALYTAHWYRHRIIPAQPVPGPIEETTLHGPLCMSIDALRRNLPLPPLVSGHRVIIAPAGAYNQTQWMQFSQLRPAVVIVAEDRSVELIRRGERFDDVKGPEELPLRYTLKPLRG